MSNVQNDDRMIAAFLTDPRVNVFVAGTPDLITDKFVFDTYRSLYNSLCSLGVFAAVKYPLRLRQRYLEHLMAMVDAKASTTMCRLFAEQIVGGQYEPSVRKDGDTYVVHIQSVISYAEAIIEPDGDAFKLTCLGRESMCHTLSEALVLVFGIVLNVQAPIFM